MKSNLKRISAGLLTLFMLLSFIIAGIPTDVFAASANTGTRHEVCTDLSDQAVAYYTGQYTFDVVSALQGGNNNCLDMDNPMFEALHNLMASTHTSTITYKSLTSYWKTVDANNGGSDAVLFYSDIKQSGYNREHVWPKSHASFLEKDGGADLHHLRPTNSTINSTRGNLPFGNVRDSGSYKTKENGGKAVLYYTSSYCEVNDNIKGDVARILLYVWCRWEEPNLFQNTSNPVVGPNDDKNDGLKVIESLDTLLQWCEMDPVDTWEMERNDLTQDVQGNRNVFIDYPEYAWLLFGEDVPDDLVSPSGNNGVTANPGGNTTPPTTNPPATQAPVTNPPATQAPATQTPTTQTPATQSPTTQTPATQPPVSQPSTSEGTQTSTPSSSPATNPPDSQPGTSEGTQTTTPSTSVPAGPAPMATNPVNPDDFIKDNDDDSSSIWVIIAVIVIALAAGGIAVWFFVIKPKKNADTDEKAAPDETPAEEIPQENPTEETPEGAPAEEAPEEAPEETPEENE